MNPPTSVPPYSNTDGAIPDAEGDALLLKRMAAGDEQALGVLYDRWHAMVHAVVVRVLREREDVDSVVEEAFFQAWRQADRYAEGRGSVQTWLLTIARSRALDRVRAVRRLREDPLETGFDGQVSMQVSSSDPGRDVEVSERRAIVRDALASLPDEQRQALELGYYGGLSQSEIADHTGQPLGTVKTRMRLAMQKLRDRLEILHEDVR